MHTSTQAAADAILSAEREFAHRLRIDWNNNGAYDHPLSELSDYVVSTKRDQTLTSTAPEEVMLIEGYAAANLTVEITGDYNGLSLAAHFAPYNGRSIFYTEGITLGVAMTYELAVSTGDKWEWFPQFVGVVRDVNTDRESGSVTFDCLDNVETMRTSVDVPPYALFQASLQEGYKRGGLVDSSSLIDLAARSAGFTMGPPQRWPTWYGRAYSTDSGGEQEYGPLLSVPFHGSILPEVGTIDGDCTFHLTESWANNQFSYRAEAYTGGPHGYLALNAVPPERHDWGYKKYWLDEWRKQGGSLNGRTWVLGCWLYWTGREVDGDSAVINLRIRESYIQLVVESSNGGVAARVVENNGWISTGQFLFMRSGWNYLQATFLFSSTGYYIMQTRVNEQRTPEVRFNRGITSTGDVLSGLATIQNWYPISDVFITGHHYHTAFDGIGYDVTPADTARVSWGRNRLAYTLREAGLEAWQLAKDVSSAEYGTVFFDEHGRFISWNYRDLISRQSSVVRSFTIDDLQKLKLRNTFDSVRNVWTVTTKTARALNDTIYDLAEDGVPFRRVGGEMVPDVFVIPGGTTKELFVPVDEYAISVFPYGVPNIQAGTADAPGFWDRYAPKHGRQVYTGNDFRHNTSAGTEQKFINRHWFRMTVGNGWAETVGFVNPDGSPRFRVSGLMVSEDQPSTWSVRDDDSVATYGERVLELENNFWLQDEFQTRAMLSDIVSRMGRPIPVSDTLTVPGDPRVQIGDTIQVRDLDGFGERMWLQVYGITREYAETGLVDTLTVEMVTAAGVGVWDSPTYGLWDQSLIWS